MTDHPEHDHTKEEKLAKAKRDAAGLDHPCKQTCSGWKQGFERGQESKSHDVSDGEAAERYAGPFPGPMQTGKKMEYYKKFSAFMAGCAHARKHPEEKKE